MRIVDEELWVERFRQADSPMIVRAYVRGLVSEVRTKCAAFLREATCEHEEYAAGCEHCEEAKEIEE